MLLKGTWILGAIYAHTDQINGGVLLPPNRKIRYRTPVTYSDGFHTATASKIFSAPAQISPESTWEKH